MEMSVSRPWQGTTMGVLNAIGVAFGFIGVIALLFGGTFIAAALEDVGMSMIAGLGTTLIAVVMIPFLILGLFITIGLFKGQKWAVILSLAFTALGTIGNITTLNFVGLAFNVFFLYCLIACLKEPFYNKN